MRSSDARNLATRAHELGATTLRGQLERLQSGGWAVDGRSVEEVLAELEGRQVYLIVVAPDTPGAFAARRTCRTCGRDYEGSECPHCREARLRLRGR
jgi:hypothetical protein